MSFGAVSRASTCKTTRGGRLSARRYSFAAWRPTVRLPHLKGPAPGRPASELSTIWSRGKRTTTRSKLKDLPQGTIPPDRNGPARPSPERRAAKVEKVEKLEKPEKAYSRMLQQHLDNMRKYPDCIILTRVGDFYELYFDQVEQYAPLVNLKQAKKGDVPMAGFQYGQLGRYLRMFVKDLGEQVAISEQVPLSCGEEVSTGLKFDRKVTRIVSAGTLIDEDFLDPTESNYLLAVHIDGTLPSSIDRERSQVYMRALKVGLSWVDLSSGELYTQSSNLASLTSLVAGIRPSEIVVTKDHESHGHRYLQGFFGEGGYSIHFYPRSKVMPLDQPISRWTPMLERPVSEKEAEAFTAHEIQAVDMVLGFVQTKLIDTDIRLQPPIRKTNDEYMTIDRQSIRGLEIRSTLRDDRFEGSLLHAVRRTVTKSGARLLSRRLTAPSMSLVTINERHDLVQQMLESDELREDVVALLRKTADVRRLLQRFSIDKGDADNLLRLAGTVNVMSRMAARLHEHILACEEAVEGGQESAMGCLWDLLARLDLEEPVRVARKITNAIDEDGLSLQQSVDEEARAGIESSDETIDAAPKSSRGRGSLKTTIGSTNDSFEADIWVMRRSASSTLRAAHKDLDKLIGTRRDLLYRLRTQLKAESLAFKWSAQSGHHCHVKTKNGHLTFGALPGAQSIGSTKTTYTFHLAEWTELGVIIDDAKLRIRKEEERVFNTLRAKVMENLMCLRRNASVLDELDVACSSAIVAKERNLVRPHTNSSTAHQIIGGRHPTVDVSLTASGRQFTSNDCAVGSQSASIYLITGPNMGGKSTYLRQNALITILAQTGCYVPATYASIGLVDKIFSRIGSADNLYQDQSTFMVEMLETANISKEATSKSFVVMDEVGRGTTPEDGVAIGYAVLKYLAETVGCRTLFATHFHDLADMTANWQHVECWCTDVEEDRDTGGGRKENSEWSYMHRMRRGINRKSHALKVARLAGMPEKAIAVAGEVLEVLQRQKERTGVDMREDMLPAVAMARA